MLVFVAREKKREGSPPVREGCLERQNARGCGLKAVLARTEGIEAARKKGSMDA